MSLQVSDLNLPADKLAQFANALGDSSNANVALQGICDGAAADIARLTAGYVIDPASLTNWGRSIALYRAYSQAQFGETPKAVSDDYKTVWDELTAIAEGKRPNLPKVSDPNQASIAGGFGGEHRLHGRVHRWDHLCILFWMLIAGCSMLDVCHGTLVFFSLNDLTHLPKVDRFTLLVDGTNNPYTDGTNIYGGGTIQLTPVNGVITTNLQPVGYTIIVPGWNRSLHFVVPRDTNTWNVVQLITNGLAALNPVTFNFGITNAVTTNTTVPYIIGSTLFVPINFASITITNLTTNQIQIISMALTNPAAFASAGVTNLTAAQILIISQAAGVTNLTAAQVSTVNNALTNNFASTATLQGTLDIGANGPTLNPDGTWFLNDNLNGDAGGGFQINAADFFVDDLGNLTAPDIVISSVPNAGNGYGGLVLGDQSLGNGDWALFSDNNGTFTFRRILTGNNNDGYKWSFDQFGSITAKSFTGSVTATNGSLLVTNTANTAALVLAGNTATGGTTRTITGSPSGIIMEGMQVAAGVVSAGTFSGAHNGSGAGLTGIPSAQLLGALPGSVQFTNGVSTNSVVTALLTLTVSGSSTVPIYNGIYVQQTTNNYPAYVMPYLVLTNSNGSGKVIVKDFPADNHFPVWKMTTATNAGYSFYQNADMNSAGWSTSWGNGINGDTITVTIGTLLITNLVVNQFGIEPTAGRSGFYGDVRQASGLPQVPPAYSVQSAKELGATVFTNITTGMLVKMFTIGDSMVDYSQIFGGSGVGSATVSLFAQMQTMYGNAGRGLLGFDTGFNAAIYSRAMPFTSINPVAVIINDGNAARAVQGNVLAPTCPVNKLGAWFYAWTNGGSITVSYTNQFQTNQWTFSTASVAPAIIYSNWPVAFSTTNQLYFQAASGTNIILGPEFANTNGGIEDFQYGHAGYVISQFNNIGTNVLQQLLTSISPNISIFHGKHFDTGDNWYSNLKTLMIQLKFSSRAVAAVLTPPGNDIVTGVTDENGIINAVITDLGGPVNNYFQLNLNGSFQDQTATHPSPAAGPAWGQQLFQEMGLPAFQTSFTGNGAGLSNTTVCLATNYNPSNFVPTPGVAKFVASNNWIFVVTTTRTNPVVQINP